MYSPHAAGRPQPNACLSTDPAPLLELRGYGLRLRQDALGLLDRLSFHIGSSEIVGLIGESGCGKTLLALSLIRLLEPKRFTISGQIFWRGEDICAWPEERLIGWRGKELAMVFQEPMTSLNPVWRVGTQVTEAIRLHRPVKAKEAEMLACQALRQAAVERPERLMLQYPHELSGGLRQRVMLAIAMANHPRLILADEPTTALDVIIQAQILDLMLNLREQTGTSFLLITHDLAVVAEVCDRALVMYAGRVVETAVTRDLLDTPRHWYTRGLLESLPGIDGDGRLSAIPGTVPTPDQYRWEGCSFAGRCTRALPHCSCVEPPWLEVETGHWSRCHAPPT
jgi:oligopeptide/dipeptide ABC transporter ATP-binding protein